jgi:hypothetical protein
VVADRGGPAREGQRVRAEARLGRGGGPRAQAVLVPASVWRPLRAQPSIRSQQIVACPSQEEGYVCVEREGG